MNRFPLDVIHRILEYDGKIKYRHGKYMNQIPKDDDRYNILKSIQPIKIVEYSGLWILSSVTIKKMVIFHISPSSYTHGEPIVSSAKSDISCNYIFTKQGFRYSWTIYKNVDWR
jgi:hypothetical protein